MFFVLLGSAVLVSGLAALAIGLTESLDVDRALGLAEASALSEILATVAGILLITNEYRHGTISATFLLTPSRPRVLAAKLLAGAVAGAVFALSTAIVAFGIAMPLLADDPEEIPIDGQLAEAIGRLLASFVVSVLVGVAVGAIVQNQVGAILATLGWFFVFEPVVHVLTSLVQGGIDEESSVGPYLLGSVLEGIVSGEDGDRLLPGGVSLLLSIAYTAALAAAGALAMVRRDPA